MDFKKRVEMCFRGNDVRCLSEKENDEEIAYITGKAVVDFLKCKKLIVGIDMREFSPILKNSFVKGVTEQGCDVIDIGMIDTPGLYFATGKFDLPGVMITASHNPIQYEGIKIVREKARPIGLGTGLEKIKELVLKNKFKQSSLGKIIKKDIYKDYKKYVDTFIDQRSFEPIKIIVDAGNGMGGKIFPLIYDGFPFKVIKECFEITGNFEKHDANPFILKNTEDLRKNIVKNKFELGIAFDSDMDRVFFVDENSKLIDSSSIAYLIIKHFSEKIKKSCFLYSVTMSKSLTEFAAHSKFKAIRCPVGHAFIKKMLKEKNAYFGCEDSGHFYYKNNFYADSGIITSLIILEIFSKEKRKNKSVKFSELVSSCNIYAKMQEKSLKFKSRENAYKKIVNYFKKQNPKKIEKIDGMSFYFDNYWCNIRISKTEPFLRFNMEANNQKILEEKEKEIETFLRNL